MPKIATLSETRALMQAHGVSAKKSLGQNFIIEPTVISRILQATGCDKQDLVLEVGPGLGSLTQALAEQAGRLLALEIDQSLLEPLNESFAACQNVHIHHADALAADIDALLTQERQTAAAQGLSLRPGFLVAANLPYYITTPLILRLLDATNGWRRLVFMVQKELAARIQAQPGGKDYGALSLAVQYRASAKIAFTVPAGCFLPRPKVDSAVIVLDKLPQPPVAAADEALLFAIIRAGFNQRRKTLANALASVLSIPKEHTAAALASANLNPSCRAESLDLAEFARLTDALLTQRQGGLQANIL